MPASQTAFYDNVTVSGGPAPARAYIEELLPDILEGRIHPGRVFDRIVGLDDVPDGYRAMDQREAKGHGRAMSAMDKPGTRQDRSSGRVGDRLRTARRDTAKTCDRLGRPPP
jgi:hypothetical protein